MGYTFNEPTEIKLIILYIIKNFNTPPDNGQITDIFMSHSFVDYFTMRQYLDEMIETGLVETYTADDGQSYLLTKTGDESLSFFIDRIPLSVRERILLSIRQYQKHLKNQLEIRAEYRAVNELEYMADCAIYERGSPLLSISMSTGSAEMARDVCRRFKTDPQKVYSELLRILLGP